MVAVAGTRTTVSSRIVTAIAEANAGWAVGSVAFAVAGASSPSTVGTIWILMQAIVVATFAGLQWRLSR
jgi:hypothetical protein